MFFHLQAIVWQNDHLIFCKHLICIELQSPDLHEHFKEANITYCLCGEKVGIFELVLDVITNAYWL